MSQPIPLGQVPAFHAGRDPRRPFVTQDERTVSRGEFAARTHQRARALERAGVGPNDRVVMLLPNGVEFFETTFALWALGATPVPAPPAATVAELQTCLELVRPRAVIGGPALAGDVLRIAADLAVDETLSTAPLAARAPSHWRISMSGGSTGKPKVIVDRTPAVADPTQAMLGQQVDGVMLNPGPLYHSGPFGLSHRALFAGNHVVNLAKFDAVELLARVERHGVDWLYLVPTMMHRIWRLPEEQRNGFDLSSLRVVFHMASPCPPWLKEQWIRWLGPERIWELYSGAENPGRTVIDGREWLAHPGSVGKVQPGARLAVFDDQGAECAPGQIGEIGFQPLIAHHTFQYIGAEPKMVGDYYLLGDLGYLDDEGYLYIADRRTDMILSGGVNIYPAEIEAALESHPGVDCSVAIGLPDPDLGARVHAIVNLAPEADGEVTEDDLRSFLAKVLVRYKLPRSFEFVREPLKDGAGKVRRSALREARVKPV